MTKLPKNTPLLAADRSISRLINQRLLAETIYENHGVSRAQLAKNLGISKPAVTSNVEELLRMGMVEERGEGTAAEKGGRKPVLLHFNHSFRFVGALDLSFREPVCAIADLQYVVFGLKRVQAPDDATPEERCALVRQAFVEILQENSIPLEKLDTIVISQPGVIGEDFMTHFAQQQHHIWTEIGLKEYLREELGSYISVRNDVNLAAIGESHFGLENRVDDLIYVTCGRGLGAGIMMDRMLYEGRGHAAGEIAFEIMEDGSRLEDYIAMNGLLNRVRDALQSAGRPEADTLSFPALVKLAQSGDALVEEFVYKTGRTLARVIYNLCIVLDIKTVVFGGEYLDLGDALLRGIEDTLEQIELFRPTVVPSILRQTAGIYGCFVLAKEKVVKRALEPA